MVIHCSQLFKWNHVQENHMGLEKKQSTCDPKLEWDWRVAEYATPKYVALVYWLFWAVGNCKTANAGRNFLLRQIFLKELNCYKSPSLEFHQPERMILITAQKTRSQYYMPANFITIIPPIYSSQVPFIFTKNHFVSPERPTSSLPFSY